MRRHKCIHVAPSTILACFNAPSGYVNRITFPGLPEDAIVEFAEFSMTRQCWVLIVSHESFDELEMGHMAPVIDAYTSITHTPVTQPSDVVPDMLDYQQAGNEYRRWRNSRTFNDINNYTKEPPN